ncbi:hypothetical protein LIER_33051 [Lithospermum erythrorhizon]|uniref:RNase H type-1 domain-containing protein n=1 Tax=Lithospermum erythrorhizon TaxID=34254 RepID=A0AAV3RVP2_LITER
MPKPRNLHELKSQLGKLEYLRSFISNLAGKCQPFSRLMKKVVKWQVLADFLADALPAQWELCEELPDEDVMKVEMMPQWKMYFDGAVHQGGVGAGLLGDYEVRKPELIPYHGYAKRLLRSIELVSIMHIPRKMNKQVDALAGLALSLTYLRAETKVQVCEKRSFGEIILRCLSEAEAAQAMSEALSGVCGAHQSGAKLHFQIKRMGYYWPTMFHANFIHQPSETLHPTTTSWPFDSWGMDMDANASHPVCASLPSRRRPPIGSANHMT